MFKKLFPFPLLFLCLGVSSQLYKNPSYPQNYFRWPTNLKPDIVANMGELRSNHWHMGLDVRTDAKVNQPVYATADGYISFAGIRPSSFGRWIVITHPNGLSTLYCHLNDFAPRLEEYITEQQYNLESWAIELKIPKGMFPVKKGDFISYSGTTGGSEGPHVHWEIFDTKSEKRLNPLLFGVPIEDNIPPVVTRIALYDRNNSVYYQTPRFFRLIKASGEYTVQGDSILTGLNKISFAIEAYDLRNGTNNRDGIYSAQLFFDDREISSFYIDSIDYDATRYMNAHIDYKLKYNGGAYVQHLSNMPGDNGSLYYPKTNGGIIQLNDTNLHYIKIVVSDAKRNKSVINFSIKRIGNNQSEIPAYEWQPKKLNKIFKNDFEAYLPMYCIYDKMNSGYSRMLSSETYSVSAKHKLGEVFIPVQDEFEVRIKPDKSISESDKSRVVIRRTSKNKTVQKAEWKGEWLAAQFKDFGTFEAFVDNTPPMINSSLGSAETVNVNKTKRITITPVDNFGIKNFRAELDGQWLRFTNDKGKTWIYNFDTHLTPGEHRLAVIVSDVAGNKSMQTWKIIYGQIPANVNEADTKKTEIPAKKTSIRMTEKKLSKPVTGNVKNKTNIKKATGKIATTKKATTKKK